NELIKAAISDQTIDKYWADELLIAVFKSESSSSFFTAFETEFLDNDATFFNRCLHIIKTCCKESYHEDNDNNLLLPVGSGWKEALFFIQKHIIQLDIIKLSIINFLTDWYWLLLFQYNAIGKEELKAVKIIVLHYIKEIEDKQKFWQKESTRSKSNELIEILLDLVEISKEDIKQLVARAFINRENRESWELNSFYKNVINECLSGTGHLRLIKELPELIIEIAWKNWKYTPPQKTDFTGENRLLAVQSLHDEEWWGIKDKFSFSPSGIYKTPFYNLLRFHPNIGLKFIIEFINYSIEFYVKANCEYKHEIYQIEIELNDETKTKIWAARELWMIYRGFSVTNYALESLLMSLEKFLLETAIEKTDVSKKILKLMFDYVLKNSNNIAPLSVLTSVTIAYPDEVEEAMLPLLSVREFYEWDLNRAIGESSSLNPMDIHIPFAQEERGKSNQLPHRKKYMRGLRDFIFDYQFNIRTLNKQIHQIFDKLKTQLLKDNIAWKTDLEKIDIRNYNKLGNYDEKLGGFPIMPEYDDDVAKYVEFEQKIADGYSKSMNFCEQLLNAYKKNDVIDFSLWLSCYEQYSSSETLNRLYDLPVTLAVLGLRDFAANLDESQKKWCLEVISNTIASIIHGTFYRDSDLNRSFNSMEKEIALFSFHLLMQNANNDEDKSIIIALMIYMLSEPLFPNNGIDKITEYVRETFFTYYPHEAKRVWLGLIKYSFYGKANPHFKGYYDENIMEIEEKKEEEFVQKISSDRNLKLDLSEINIEKSESYLLARAFVITPYNAADKDFSDFINHVLPIVLDDFPKEDDFSCNRARRSRQFNHESILNIEQYLADLLLNANLDFSKTILTTLVNSVSNASLSHRFEGSDVAAFAGTTLDYFVTTLYDNGNSNAAPNLYAQQLTNFWNLWEVLFNLIPANSNHPLSKKLLFDVRFLIRNVLDDVPNLIGSNVLNGKKDFYKRALLEKGKNLTSSAIKVFSTIGEKEFLPDGISWLVEIFKSDFDASESLTS
ncbi:MAG: hypothetical protein FWD47_15355, partial [Treponema sp.]|nr:hypothetical protein [Treponema sp.]